MLKDYVKKERSSGKSKNKLMKTVLTNQETIQNMNTYHDQETQTKEEENSMENPSSFLQNNSSTNNLYSSGHWGMEWNEEKENLIPRNDYYTLDDLYTIRDYDNVLRSDYEG